MTEPNLRIIEVDEPSRYRRNERFQRDCDPVNDRGGAQYF
jgi:hypothetical protein